MMHISKVLKDKRDAEQRLRQSDPGKSTVYVGASTPGTSPGYTNPVKPKWEDIQGNPFPVNGKHGNEKHTGAYITEADHADIDHTGITGCGGGEGGSGTFDYGLITSPADIFHDYGGVGL